MIINKRLKAIRLEERYTQEQFAKEVDIPLGTLRSYEQLSADITGKNLNKIVTHEKFSKYAYWLISGQISGITGQTSPVFSNQEKCGIIEREEVKRA